MATEPPTALRPSNPPPPTTSPTPSEPPSIFSPEEEATLLQTAHLEKASANTSFTSGDFSSAVQGYEKALAACPTYLDYDVAVLRSNIAACFLKMEEWKDAVEQATMGIQALDRLDPRPVAEGVEEGKDGAADGAGKGGERNRNERFGGGGAVVEIDAVTEVRLEALARTGKSINDVYKLRTKTLLRRAKARREVNSWSALQGALEDYQALAKPPHQLASLDQKAVLAALRELPDKLEDAKNREVGEMMGKLKQLGNGILKPFGLSTDNFQFTKDEKTGGYGMQFNQKPKQ